MDINFLNSAKRENIMLLHVEIKAMRKMQGKLLICEIRVIGG